MLDEGAYAPCSADASIPFPRFVRLLVRARRDLRLDEWRKYVGSESTTRRRLRRRTVIGLAVVAGLFAILAAVVVVIVLVSGSSHGTGLAPHRSPVPLWRTVGPLALIAISLVLGGVAIAGMVRGRYIESAQRAGAALRSLTRPERKQVLRQIRGQQPADRGQLSLAREIAQSRVDQRVVLFSVLGTALAVVAMLFLRNPEASHAVSVVAAALDLSLVAVGAPLMIREVRRAQRFLRLNPLPEADATDERPVDPHPDPSAKSEARDG